MLRGHCLTWSLLADGKEGSIIWVDHTTSIITIEPLHGRGLRKVSDSRISRLLTDAYFPLEPELLKTSKIRLNWRDADIMLEDYPKNDLAQIIAPPRLQRQIANHNLMSLRLQLHLPQLRLHQRPAIQVV